MIFITQGHQDSIAIEILLKSLVKLNPNDLDLFTIIINKDDLRRNMDKLELNCTVTNDGLEINDHIVSTKYFNSNTQKPHSCISLEIALEMINSPQDILLTMPTSKDQLPLKGMCAAGYTEYLRRHFDNSDVAMLFKSDTDNFLLVTDHIPLKSVPTTLNAELIVNKTSNTLKCYLQYFQPIDEVFFAGINPHAGESGILGDEEIYISKAIDILQQNFPKIIFHGPLSADTLHMHRNLERNQLFVYMFHDQGLPVFKSHNRLVGLNVSAGLPFLRMSVDHGTAFELNGKNRADYSGCLYLIRESINIQRKLWNKKK